MRVAMIVSNACDPDPRVEKEAAALASAGHDVTVIAWDRAGSSAAEEVREGFTIKRIGPRAPYGGGVRSLPLFRRFWKLAAEHAVALHADVVHSHDTDAITPGLSAVRRLRSQGRDVAFVVDFHEWYRVSKMVPQRGLVGIASRAAVSRLEARAVEAADIVVVANEGVIPMYREEAGDKLVFVPNAADEAQFRPLPCEEDERPFTVMFIGRKRYARTLESLAVAIQTLPGTCVVLAGGGPDAAEVDALAQSYERVVAEGPVPYRDIPSRYACADVVYAAYDAVVGNARVCTPGKVLEAMACAKPVLVTKGTWIGDWVERNGIGVAVDADDPASVTNALAGLVLHPELCRTMGARGRAIVEEGLNWASSSRSLTDAYGRIAARINKT